MMADGNASLVGSSPYARAKSVALCSRAASQSLLQRGIPSKLLASAAQLSNTPREYTITAHEKSSPRRVRAQKPSLKEKMNEIIAAKVSKQKSPGRSKSKKKRKNSAEEKVSLFVVSSFF
jgi:hypothetical protein